MTNDLTTLFQKIMSDVYSRKPPKIVGEEVLTPILSVCPSIKKDKSEKNLCSMF